MHVVVDDSAAFNQGAGIGRYARNLLPALVQAKPDLKLTLFYAPEPGVGARFAHETTSALAGNKRLRVRSSPLDRRRMDQLWFRAHMPVPIGLWSGPHELVYSPDFTVPPSFGCKSIMTVHDLAFLITPERAPKALRDYLSRVVPRQVRKSTAVVAVSETTKLDLMQRLGVESDKITVVPNAVEARFYDAKALTLEERSMWNLPERYLLTVGTIEPRKNHRTLFAALRTLKPGSHPPLVVAGRVGWDSAEIMTEARQLELEGRIILLDYVDDRFLPGLYAGADAVIYPSWYEGFGLPVLEGMASGTRVIASDVPAHREVSDNTVLLVQPGETEALAAEIERVCNQEPDPNHRMRRIERARAYTWAASGRQLAHLFDQVTSS